jgi:hypothetical protein
MTKTENAPRQASGRKYWTAEQARVALEAWRASGLTMKDYALSTGLNARRMSWWKVRMERWGEGERPGNALRLVPITTSVEVSPLHRGTAMAILRLPGGAALEFDAAEVPPGWVAAVAIEATRAQ